MIRSHTARPVHWQLTRREYAHNPFGILIGQACLYAEASILLQTVWNSFLFFLCFRSCLITRLIRVRHIKIALVLQSFITTVAVIYIMYSASNLDQPSKWEISFTDKRCQGCCVMHNSSIQAIVGERHISEKLHKFSRAIRQYDIPVEIMNVLHEAEHLIEQFERDLKQYNKLKDSRMTQLQEKLIEEDVLKEQDLVPKAKPKWNRQQNKI